MRWSASLSKQAFRLHSFASRRTTPEQNRDERPGCDGFRAETSCARTSRPAWQSSRESCMFRARSRWRWPARRRKVSGDVARDSRESASIGNHRGESSPPPAWHIFAALAATVLGFAGSILFSHHIASRIDDDAVSIATDASPAIQHLTMARTEVLRIQLAAAVAIENAAEGVPLDRAPFASSLARLHGELSAYLVLPLYPRERDYYNEADQATH